MKIINFLIIFSLVLPGFCLAQGVQAPETLDEVKSVGLRILGELPGAAMKIWKEEALPFFLKVWEKFTGFIGSKIEPFWQKFLGLLGKEVEKRKPDLEKEFQKEKTEMEKDLWGKFKELLK